MRLILPGELAKHGTLAGTERTHTKIVHYRDASGRLMSKRVHVALAGLGADAGEAFHWDTAAQALATPAFASTPAAVYVLVSFAAGGTSPQVLPFSSLQAGRQAYSDLTETPSDRVYAAGYCKNSDGTTDQCDEWFGTQIRTFTSWFSKYKIKTYAPWVIGGAVLLGVVYYSSKKKPGRARRRARGSWRRRTVTTWR